MIGLSNHESKRLAKEARTQEIQAKNASVGKRLMRH
ncbi:hypothetical protein OROMI_001839 [Orobanche minor]